MTINLYNNTSDNNVLDKNITFIASHICDIKGEIDLDAPTFILAHVPNEFYNANYLYSQEYDRYYYIQKKRGLLGARMVIECYIDPLMSFKGEIKQMYVLADRAGESLHNPYFDNGTLVTDCVHAKEVINYPYGFDNDGKYILVTCGHAAEA